MYPRVAVHTCNPNIGDGDQEFKTSHSNIGTLRQVLSYIRSCPKNIYKNKSKYNAL